jgi:hypothetical protein
LHNFLGLKTEGSLYKFHELFAKVWPGLYLEAVVNVSTFGIVVLCNYTESIQNWFIHVWTNFVQGERYAAEGEQPGHHQHRAAPSGTSAEKAR